MELSNLTSSHGRSWSEERVHVGTIILFGLSCSHAPTPGRHSCRISFRHGRQCSSGNKEKMDIAGKQHYTNRRIKAYTESLGHADCSSSHAETLGRRRPHSTDMARLKAAAASRSEDWPHVPLIMAVSVRLSDEAIHVTVKHRLGCTTCSDIIT